MKKLSRLKIAMISLVSVIAVTIGGGIAYLESEAFANSIKKMISERSPERIGVVGDFSHLKIYFFPPGVGVANPKIHIEKENLTRLPIEGDVEAKELRASFAPIQMFSGVLRVQEVEVNGGAVQGKIYSEIFKTQPAQKKPSPKLSWKDLIQLQINGVHFVDTYLNLITELPGKKKQELGTEFVVKDLVLEKKKINDRDGLTSSAMVRAVRLSVPPGWASLPFKEANQLQWELEFTDQGLKLNPFTLDISGIHVAVQGEIEGNLLDENSDSSFQGKAAVSSDLGTFFLANENDDQWSGELEGHAEVHGKLKDLESSLKVKFGLEAKNLTWRNVKASAIRSEGDFDLSENLLHIGQVEFEDRSLADSSGKVKVGAVDVSLDFRKNFKTEVQFENADIHWVGGIVARAMAPLEAKLTGKVGAEFVSERKGWRLKLAPDLSIREFQLTNQKLGEKRVMKHILRPPLPLLLKGGLEIDPSGVDFKDFNLGIKKTQLKVTGGVHASSGFEFSAKGPIEMKEIHEIAGNEIRGEGTLDARIHGTADELLLDFDTQLNHAAYLNLDFGNLKGRVTYDDGISELRFSDIKANQKNTFYSLKEGFIDLSGGDDLNLPIEINSGRIEDLATILHSMTQKISWFPNTLKGAVHGSVDIAGKVDTPRLVIHSEIEGSDWTWMNERARRVKMNLGYDQGVYFARKVNLSKSAGAIKGGIEFNASSDELEWDFTTEGLSLNDFDFFERLELPARSKMEIRSTGSGRMGRLRSNTFLRAYDTEIKGDRLQTSDLNLVTGENQLTADLNLFGGQASSQLKYSLIPKQPSFFRMDLNNLDFSPPLLILNPKLVDDPDLLARATGHIQLDFLSTQSELARGEFQISRYELQKTGFSLKLIDPISVPIQLGYFQFKPARLHFNNSELTLSGEGKKGDVDFRIKGDADLSISEVLTPAIQKAVGTADTDIRIHGPLKDLKMDGDISFTGARLLTRWMQSPLEEVDGSISLNRGRILIESFDAYLGDELLTLAGKIDTFTDRFPEMDLRAVFDNNKIKMEPFDLFQGRGVLTIKGSAPPYRIGGNLELTQALYSKSFGQSSGPAAGRGERFMPKDQEKQFVANLFDLDLNLNAPQGFFVRNEIVDAEFRGRARLIGSPESPRLLGEGRLVQGKVLFKDRPFIFESAKIEFDDPYQLNPKFNASAISEVNQYKIRVLVYGRSSQWKAEFTSTPYLRENEIFAVLSSGSVSSDTSRFASRDRSLVSQGEAASLILHSMDFSKDVQSKTGFQFDVEEAVDSQTANSIFRPQNLSDNIAAPKVVLKRSVGRNMSVSFGSTVGVGSRNQKEVNAEYKLSSGSSMLGVWNNIEGVNTRESRTSFGLDLKFNKRFK